MVFLETQAQPGDICSAGNATPHVKVSGFQAEIGSRILKKKIAHKTGTLVHN
jgi:hypothetical protein